MAKLLMFQRAIFLLATSAFTNFLFGAEQVLGKETTFPKIAGAPEITEETLLPEFIVYLYYFAVAISGFIALAILTYGGVRYLISADSPAKKAEAKGFIWGGLAGLLILMLAYIILTTINPQLTILKFGDLERAKLKERPFAGYATIDFTKSAYQEVPLGTLIEAVLDENKIEQFRAFLKQAEKQSDEVRGLAEELKKETENCSCTASRMTPASCALSINSCSLEAGSCTGEPCDRAALEKKKQKLQAAIDELEPMVISQMPFLNAYLGDIAALYYASLLMKEGILPTPYEQFIELEQLTLNYVGATMDRLPFQFGGQTIRAAGYDPMNFYFDYEENKEIFEGIKFEISFDIVLPPGTEGEPPPSNPGALTWPFPNGCLTARAGKNVPEYPFTCHRGIDIGDGIPNKHLIYAAGDGEVLGTGYCGGKGNWVLIWHENLGLSTLYQHLESGSIAVKAGDKVSQGDVVGREDETGLVFGEHLHFEVHSGKSRVIGECPVVSPLNPLDYLTPPCRNQGTEVPYTYQSC